MNFIQAFKMAIKSIVSNKIRSFLTMLGVIIGVGSVIAAVAFAQGTTKSVTDTIQGLGTNLIQISITGRNSNRNVTYEDLKKFAEDNEEEISYLAPQVSGSVTVKVGSKTRSTTMNGTSPEYAIIKSQPVQQGRYILSFDIDSMQKVAVIGTAVANDVFAGTDPVGQTILINGNVFKVIGVLQQKQNGADQSDDDQIILPVNVAQRVSRNSQIRNFLVQASTPETVDKAMEELNIFLTKIYKTNTNSSAFRVFNQAQMLSSLNNVTGQMMVILGGIAAISLIVGGIGIMNIMLVSVTERTREIGIRKAIGAKRKNILIQFLIEAAMVTGIGGLIGILLGILAIKFIVSKQTTPVYSTEWMMISFFISLGVGVVFGMFPAYKAAKLNPIEALRFE